GIGRDGFRTVRLIIPGAHKRETRRKMGRHRGRPSLNKRIPNCLLAPETRSRGPVSEERAQIPVIFRITGDYRRSHPRVARLCGAHRSCNGPTATILVGLISSWVT